MSREDPAAIGALKNLGGPVLALLVLAAFAATMQHRHKRQDESADLAQVLLLADRLLNHECFPGVDPRKDSDGVEVCPHESGTLGDMLINSDRISEDIHGVSYLFGRWAFRWSILDIQSQQDKGPMQSADVRQLVKSQEALMPAAGGPRPHYYGVVANIDETLEPRRIKKGLLFLAPRYREIDPSIPSIAKRVVRERAAVAVFPDHFSGTPQIVGLDAIDSTLIDLAIQLGHPVNEPKDAYASMLADLARTSVLVPIVNIEVDPQLAGLTIVIATVGFQLFTIFSLGHARSEVWKGAVGLKGTLKIYSMQIRGLVILGYIVCIFAPIFTAFWAFELSGWAGLSALSGNEPFGAITILLVGFVTLVLVMNSFLLSIDFLRTVAGKK